MARKNNPQGGQKRDEVNNDSQIVKTAISSLTVGTVAAGVAAAAQIVGKPILKIGSLALTKSSKISAPQIILSGVLTTAVAATSYISTKKILELTESKKKIYELYSDICNDFIDDLDDNANFVE